MKFNGYFKTLGSIKNTVDFENLKTLLRFYNWTEDKNLLDTSSEDPAFKDSYCIQFTFSPLMRHIRDSYKQNYLNSTQEIIKVGDIVVTELHQLFSDHYHLKSHFVAIKPKGEQICHIDDHFYHKFSRRLVVPVITTSQASTNFKDASFILETGTIYEMNNRIPHWSSNEDEDYRIFLFADFIPRVFLPLIKHYYKFTD